jgi:hypothetical protein
MFFFAGRTRGASIALAETLARGTLPRGRELDTVIVQNHESYDKREAGENPPSDAVNPRDQPPR